jgi:hypothetical protein
MGVFHTIFTHVPRAIHSPARSLSSALRTLLCMRDTIRIVWLAAADARGHLMRAHLMRTLLAERNVHVSVVTTSEQGEAFLGALGTPAQLLSNHYGVAFDGWQNMDRARTEACVLRYLLTPSRGLRDARRLERLCHGADLLVNDFHPLPLFAGAAAHAALPPIVHVYGENLWRAIEHNFAGRGPAFVDRRYSALVRALRDQAQARIEHTLAGDAGPRGGRFDYVLPPVVAVPCRSTSEVRADLGVRSGVRLAAVYLNPHFVDPALAEMLEAALQRHGFAMHAVGEGFASRAGWLPYDRAFGDVVAAADLLLAAPGMAAVGQACLLGTPMVALVTDQPEQRDNLAYLRAPGAPPSLAVALHGPAGQLAARLDAAVGTLGAASAPRRADGRRTIRAIHRRWVDTLLEIAGGARAPAPTRSDEHQPHAEVFA